MKIKRTIIFILMLSLTLSFSINAYASSDNTGRSWFIRKNKAGGLPGFPDDLVFIEENHGYCIDEKASKTGEKILYLTFDAGYENGNIEKILNILKEEETPAAFFILSNLIKKKPDLIKRMFEEGHLVCNHTKNHKDMTTLTPEEMAANLRALEELNKETTGYEMAKFFRFPEGRYSHERIEICSELGYSTFFWSIAYADWDENNQPSAEKAKAELLKQTHPGAVILLHPTSTTNAKILRDMIALWKKEGYRFGTLSELIERNSAC